MFEAFNHRNSEAMRPCYATDVEFFHDQVGRTLHQDAVITTFGNKFEGDYVERHQIVQREVIRQSLRLYPIPGYGVLEVGNHRFTISTRESKRVAAVTVGSFGLCSRVCTRARQAQMTIACYCLSAPTARRDSRSPKSQPAPHRITGDSNAGVRIALKLRLSVTRSIRFSNIDLARQSLF
jgi:hypothetical protein